MSNIKEIQGNARVAFDWIEHLASEDQVLLSILFNGPSVNLHYDYFADGYDANDHGGKTAMYRMAIEGREALRYSTLVKLKEVLAKGDPAAYLKVRDMEAYGSTPGPWEHL